MPQRSFRALIVELKRRRVLRVAGFYTVAAWILVQVASTVFPILAFPGWTIRLVLVLSLLGFFPAVGLAWAFDLDVTPDRNSAPPAAQAPPGEPEPAKHGRERAVRVRLPLAVAAVLVAALVAAGVWARWASPAGPGASITADAVAVFPFDVRAGNEDAYLRDGMVSLLAARLDGLGGLRSADPQGVLRSVPGGPPGLVAAAHVASHFGAGLYVLGTVVGGAGRVEITASLYRSDGTAEPVATASAEGAADSVFGVVDRVAMQLLSSRARDGESDAVRTAALTTSSLPAFRAYLDGERALRAMRVGPAIDAFTRAVAIDSTFALAYSRLALAAWWDRRRAAADSAAAAGDRHSGRLPPHYREILAANHALMRGDPDAEARFRDILTRYPHDAEVWYMLGEKLFHHAFYSGRPISEARRPFEEALRLDPANEMYLVHLRDLACIEDRARDLTRLNPNNMPDSVNPLVDGTMVALAGTAPERERALRALEAASSAKFFGSLTEAFTCAPPEAVSRLLQMADRRTAEEDSWQQLLFDLAGGRWAAAKAATDPSRITNPVDQTAARSRVLLLLPLTSPSADEMRRVVADLQSLDVEHAVPPTDPVGPVVTELFRLYLIGRLSSRLGEWQEENLMEAALQRPLQGPPDARRWAVFLATRLRAFAFADQGRHREALHALEEIDAMGVVGDLAPHPLDAYEPDDRWLRAELLRELGRDREALEWYHSLSWGSPEFVAPAQLRMGQVLDRLGEKREAARHYRRFVAIWHDADPALQPLVRDASARMRELAH
jgi:tetratricopeptide (TPR) repeat protein